MKCEQVKAVDWETPDENIRLSAVIDGSEENKQWAKYTPGGILTLHISNPGAQGKFEVGKEYYIDITPAN